MDSVARPVFDSLADGHDQWYETAEGRAVFASEVACLRHVAAPLNGRWLDVGVGTGRFAASTFRGVLLALTLCFVAYPERALQECQRVLCAGGGLLIGIIPADSAWGRAYELAASRGHPVYGVARFFTAGEIVSLVEAAGFRLLAVTSTLFWGPGDGAGSKPRLEPGIVREAGFVGLSFERVAIES